ncbi:MAG: hypothetical protein ACLFVU_14510 [Phycisphaerae bacterium]
MKKALIVALFAVNVALLGAMVMGNEPAYAQSGWGPDYLLFTSRIGSTSEAVVIVDLKQDKMVAMRMDKAKKRLVPIRGRELKTDFDRRGN